MILVDVFIGINMPLIDIADNAIYSSTPLAGSNYVSSLALSENARVGSIKVGIGNAELLKADNGGIIWTDSLQSCFPVIFKFSNGDIALYHGNNASVDDIPRSIDGQNCSIGSLLRRNDLEEIQLFEKNDQNARKVGGFVGNILRYCAEHQVRPPQMNLKDSQADYNALVCYKSPQAEPTIPIAIESTGKII